MPRTRHLIEISLYAVLVFFCVSGANDFYNNAVLRQKHMTTANLIYAIVTGIDRKFDPSSIPPHLSVQHLLSYKIIPETAQISDTEAHHPFGGSIDVKADEHYPRVFWISLHTVEDRESCTSVVSAAETVAGMLTFPTPALHNIVVQPDTRGYPAASLTGQHVDPCLDHANAIYLQFGPSRAPDSAWSRSPLMIPPPNPVWRSPWTKERCRC